MDDSLPYLRFLIAGRITRNFTILPSGSVHEDVLGGSVLYGAAGAGLWESGIGLVARIGSDFPVDWLQKIDRWKLDRRGIRQVAEQIDLREFIAYPDPETRITENPVAVYSQMGLAFPKTLLGFNCPPVQLDSRTRPGILTIRQSDMPSDYMDATAAHICPMDYLSHTLLPPTLRQGHVHTITLDPGWGYMDPTFFDDMPVILSGLSAFLCSEEKLSRLFAGRSNDLWEMAEAIAGMGCDLVAVKRGAAGQMVYDRQSKSKWLIPAYPANIHSLNGAGDAFGGGFMAGFRTTYDPLQAALRGNIAASFVLEGTQPFYAFDTMPGLADARLASLKDRVRRV